MNIDALYEMSDEEKLNYLHEEVEKIISEAPPNKMLKLRALQARMDGMRRTIKDPLVRAGLIYQEMLQSLDEFKAALSEIR